MQRELICKGSTGDVFKAMNGSRIVAIKMLDSRRASRMLTSVDATFHREVRALKAVSHRNIISLISSDQVSPSEFSIVMSYCSGGSLFQLLYKRGDFSLTIKQKKKIFSDILNAISHLHQRNNPIIHGDIKSLNLLFMSPVTSEDAVPWVKLCDFGSSRFAEDPLVFGTLTVGTVQWMAPEVLSGGPPDEASDIYSVGMVFYEVCSRKIPFVNFQENVVSAKVISGDRPEISIQILKRDGLGALAGVIISCWSADPSSRPDITELISRLNGVFISSVLSLEGRMSIP
jgi:serine/threonine protein kinase